MDFVRVLHHGPPRTRRFLAPMRKTLSPKILEHGPRWLVNPGALNTITASPKDALLLKHHAAEEGHRAHNAADDGVIPSTPAACSRVKSELLWGVL